LQKIFVGYDRIEKMKTMSDWLSRAAALPASCRAAISFVVRESGPLVIESVTHVSS
jgi:hypothetical protein